MKKRIVILTLILAMVVTIFSQNVDVSAKTSEKTKLLTLIKGKTIKVTLSGVKGEKVKKITAGINKKSIASVKKSGKKAGKIIGKKAGKATVTVRAEMRNGRVKKYRYKIVVDTKLKLSNRVIRITCGKHTATFRLYDTTAAKELYKQLPLTLKVSNFEEAQWMFYPPKKLHVSENEAYHDGKKGELSYYEPWGDVFILYKDFYARDNMHRLGICLTGIDELEQMSGKIEIRKEK